MKPDSHSRDFGVKDVHAFFDKKMHERQVNRVQYGFPSIHFYGEKIVPVKELMAQRQKRKNNGPSQFHLYVGTPYCIRTDPEKCGYCLFPVEVFTGMKQLDTYLHYLEMEGRMYQEFFEDVELSSIYFGGGTANLYKAKQYPKLMELIRQVFPNIDPSITITMEGIPQLYTREKLEVMKEIGINRISVGVQQLDDELNKLSGRRQKVEHTLQTIEWCQELGLPCNADIIFGWPQQTVELMMEGLAKLVATGIDYITHYELNVGGPSDFALNRQDELPSVEENLEMYHASRHYLEGEGFRQLTTYNFEKTHPGKNGEHHFEECVRGFENIEVWGWGYAGISRFSGTPDSLGWNYINYRNVNDYFAAIKRGRFPIERGFHYDVPDMRLTFLFSNLIGMEVDLRKYDSAFQVDLIEEYRPIWHALSERGWAEVSSEKIRLVGDGGFYTPLISTLLASSRVDELKNIYYDKQMRTLASEKNPSNEMKL